MAGRGIFFQSKKCAVATNKRLNNTFGGGLRASRQFTSAKLLGETIVWQIGEIRGGGGWIKWRGLGRDKEDRRQYIPGLHWGGAGWWASEGLGDSVKFISRPAVLMNGRGEVVVGGVGGGTWVVGVRRGGLAAADRINQRGLDNGVRESASNQPLLHRRTKGGSF